MSRNVGIRNHRYLLFNRSNNMTDTYELIVNGRAVDTFSGYQAALDGMSEYVAMIAAFGWKDLKSISLQSTSH